MDIVCENLPHCGFFRKYGQSTKALACQGLIAMYCKSERMIECKRLEYFDDHGKPPPDDMMPTGKMMIQP